MRNKAIIAALLVIIMGALFMPLTAYATELPEEMETPDAGLMLDGSAEIASDEETDNEVFADRAPDYMEMLDFFSMFSELSEPGATQSPKPLTPDGQATVTDQATEYDGKEFYTFTTPAGNVFFLVIDHARASDNVYFLNAVTESDLIALAEKAGEPIAAVENAPPAETQQPPAGADEPDGAEPPPDEAETPDKGNGMIIFVVIAVLAAGGIGYYVKIVRPKKQAVGDDDEDEDEPFDDGDIPFDDEAEDMSDYDGDGNEDDDYGYNDEDPEDNDNMKEGREDE
jgi:hypothetical protein